MENYKVYKMRSNPLMEARCFVDGEKYVASNGDVLEWDGETQNFTIAIQSPLDMTLENNTVENLTEVQLNLFWTLCK